MSPAAVHRAYAWISAAVAAGGLLLFGWSPTELLLLYWLDNAVYVLLPMLVSIAAVLTAPHATLGQRAIVLFFVGLLTAIFAAFILGHGAMILFFDLASRPEEFGARFGEIPVVPMGPLIVSLVGEPAFLASAAVVAGSVIVDLRPGLAQTWRARRTAPVPPGAEANAPASSAPVSSPPEARAPGPAASEPAAGTSATAAGAWIQNVGDRILVTQAALVLGGVVVMLLRLPAAAALLLVALKLWLDLRRARRLEAPPPAPSGSTPAADRLAEKGD